MKANEKARLNPSIPENSTYFIEFPVSYFNESLVCEFLRSAFVSNICASVQNCLTLHSGSIVAFSSQNPQNKNLIIFLN